MLNRIMTAGFQNVVKANHVAFDVSVRVCDGVTHTCLSAQIDHNIRVILLKNAVDQRLVRKIALNKGVFLELLKLSKTSFLDANIIIIVHVIQTDDLDIRLSGQNTLGKVGADKSG